MTKLERAKDAAVAAKKRAKGPTCAQLKAKEDKIRKQREAKEAKNAAARGAKEEKLKARHDKDTTKLAARHAKERAALATEYGCEPPAPRKTGKRGPRKAKAPTDAVASSEAAPTPTRAPRAKKASKKTGKRASKAASKSSEGGERSPQPVGVPALRPVSLAPHDVYSGYALSDAQRARRSRDADYAQALALAGRRIAAVVDVVDALTARDVEKVLRDTPTQERRVVAWVLNEVNRGSWSIVVQETMTMLGDSAWHGVGSVPPLNDPRDAFSGQPLAALSPTQRARSTFRDSEQTVGDILRRAYARTWVFPWEQLPDDAPAVVVRDRDAWTALLTSGIGPFDVEARYSEAFKIYLSYLAADDDLRAGHDDMPLRDHLLLGRLAVLAAKEAGFGVDGDLLEHAQQTGLVPDRFIVDNLVRLRALAGNEPGRFIREQVVERVAASRTQRRSRKTAPVAPAPPATPALPRPVALAPSTTPDPDLFSDNDIRDIVRKINAGTITLEEYQAGYRRLLASREGLLALWSSQSKQALAPKAAAADLARYTKKELVARKWDGWVRAFVLSDSPGSFLITIPGKHRDTAENVRALVEAVTPEKLARYNAAMQAYIVERAAEVASKKARMADPQTLEDYQLVVTHRGDKALTPAQRVRYDDLRAEATMERVDAERGPRAITVPAVGKSWQIVDTWHFRREVPTWTVQKDTRGRDIPADEFKALNAAARALGGGWERFAKNAGERKAVAGFLFYSREAAEKFVAALAGETVDNAEEAEAREARKTAEQAAHLRELAGRTGAAASEDLGRERLTNTYRRSEQAASSQQQARTALGLAESLERIADAIANHNAKFLGHIRHKVQVETLDRLLRQAQYRRRSQEGRSSSDDLDSPSVEDVDAVVYPYPTFYGNVVRGIAQDAEKVPGFKLAAKAMQKFVRGKDSQNVAFTHESEIEQLRKLVRAPGGKRIAGELEDYDRVQSMRLVNLSTLRAALREYLGCCKGRVERESPLAAKERGLVGRQFPGYFPTPRDLAAEVVELADIRAGHRVLEPSAGKGDLAAAVRAAAPSADLVTVELQYELAELLRDKGFTVAARDFLAETPASLGTFDRIVANPPFEDLGDIDHVRHMWSFLRPGGRIVSIMSEAPFFRQDRKAEEFRAWLAGLGGTATKNPEGSFRSSDRPTGVATRTVILERRR